MKVDAHHHFWRMDRGVNGWIDESVWELRRDYLPSHIAPYLAQLGIDRTILVQAAETLSENQFMLDLVGHGDFVGGIVAWVDLTAKDVVGQLEGLAQYPIIKGIRPVLQGISQSDWILRPEVMAALKHLTDMGLRFDALVQPRHLPHIVRLAEMIPDLRIVIDHAAKPTMAAPEPEWRYNMAVLAQNPMIYCKLSGLATEYGQGWNAPALSPVSDALLDMFGPKRLMWGSDWPVLERHGSYVQWYAQALSLIDEPDRPWVFGKAAAAFYGLE